MSGRFTSVPVFLYHAVLPVGASGHPYDVTDLEFERQLAHLAQAGCRSTSFRELCDEPASADPPAGRRVVLTFDDAHLGNYTATLPLLRKHGFTGTFFMPTAFVGRDSTTVTMEHLREMHEQGMEIQSHSHSHPFLDELSRETLREELDRSKAILETELQAPVDVLACPGGRYNRTVLELAGRAGYRAVCNSRPGLGASRSDGVWLFDRLLIQRTTSYGEFRALAGGRGAILSRKRLAYGLKATLKSTLGGRRYHALWRFASRVLGR